MAGDTETVMQRNTKERQQFCDDDDIDFMDYLVSNEAEHLF